MGKNILVTGSHRSGTTWTGRVIAKSDKVMYVHEPFNIDNPGVDSPFTYWYEYLNDTSLDHQQKVKVYLESFTSSIFHKQTIKSLQKIQSLRGLKDFMVDAKDRITSEKTLIKDPIALMSAEWLYENYDCDIVILIRHPAAFVASCKMRGWGFDFNDFLNQSSLMEKHFMDYKDVIEEYAKNQKELIDQNILIWNLIHEMIYYYKNKFKDEWYFIEHETLSKNALPEFEKMFSKLNLKFSNKVKKFILKSTTSNRKSNLTRNSVDNIKTWKKRLSQEEIDRIKIGTQKVWSKFYSEEDW